MIRRAGPRDRERLLEITRASDVLTDEEIGWAAELIREEVPPVRGREYHLDLLEVNGTIAGYVCYGPAAEPRAFDLYWVVIGAGSLRKGHGRRLVAHAERKALEAGARHLLIETSEKNRGARAFYEALGYAEVSQTKDFSRLRPGRVLYCRDLGESV